MNESLRIAGWADPMMVAKLGEWKRSGGTIRIVISEARPGMQIKFSELPVGSAVVLKKVGATGNEKHVWVKTASQQGGTGWVEKRDYTEIEFAGVRYIEKMSIPYIEDLAQGKIIVLRNNDVNRLVILRCPCGCGQDIILQLATPIQVPDQGTLWELEEHGDGTVTLKPSVVNMLCGTHFIVDHSKTLI